MKNFVLLSRLAVMVMVSFLISSSACSSSCNKTTPPTPVPTAQSCIPGKQKLLAVKLRPQETDQWCWAASGQMVMEFLGGSNVTQCDEANKFLNETDCCNSPIPQKCVQPGLPQFDKYGFKFLTSATPLTWDQITDQISCKGKPFVFIKYWTGGGGHALVAKGYKKAKKARLLSVWDPLPVNVGDKRWITYSAYQKGTNYTLGETFYDVTK